MKQFKVLSIDALCDGQELDHIEISTWFERDCAQVIATDTFNDVELFSLMTPESCAEFIADGFKKTGDSWEKAVTKYLKYHGLTGDHGLNWTWNQWYTIGEFTSELTEASALKYFQDNYLHPNYADQYEIDDDQYNLVLVHKKTRKPILAIEYGNA